MINFATTISKIVDCTDTTELANLFYTTFPEFHDENLTWEECRDNVFIPGDPEYQLICLFINRCQKLED